MINGRKFRNSSLFVLTLALLVSLCIFSVSAVGDPAYDFPNFSEADSMAFVEEQNIEIPSGLQQLDSLPEFTQELILLSCATPDMPFGFNAPDTQTYAEAIRLAVRSCLDLSVLPMPASTSTLQYNTMQDADGNWVTSGGMFKIKWLGYNCYAFSINRAEPANAYPSVKPYQPGDMMRKNDPDDFYDPYDPTDPNDPGILDRAEECSDVYELAELIRNDLLAMGYSNITLSSSIPTINSSQELICVRFMENQPIRDYHFMRYDLETDAWYHKPGQGAVLKYNYVPSNNRPWYMEGYDFEDGIYCYPFFSYNSEIVFISYSKKQLNFALNNTSREYIQPWKDIFCEINASKSGNYNISLESNELFVYELYNEDFDVVS